MCKSVVIWINFSFNNVGIEHPGVLRLHMEEIFIPFDASRDVVRIKEVKLYMYPLLIEINDLPSKIKFRYII